MDHSFTLRSDADDHGAILVMCSPMGTELATAPMRVGDPTLRRLLKLYDRLQAKHNADAAMGKASAACAALWDAIRRNALADEVAQLSYDHDAAERAARVAISAYLGTRG